MLARTKIPPKNVTKIFVSEKKRSDTKSSIREIPNLSTDAGRSTDTERYYSGDVWTDIQKYGQTKHGGWSNVMLKR